MPIPDWPYWIYWKIDTATVLSFITSQLPVEAWYNFIDEPTLADAIMDRLTASAHRLPLQGKSMRKKKNH
ncbi:ATP-binding protein [Olivibacter sp. SDN3]|uniref:ATP-binding protein n=1 Tax=unclassified Olivibacter TaxID=2632301 RepID=UPI00351AEA81